MLQCSIKLREMLLLLAVTERRAVQALLEYQARTPHTLGSCDQGHRGPLLRRFPAACGAPLPPSQFTAPCVLRSPRGWRRFVGSFFGRPFVFFPSLRSGGGMGCEAMRSPLTGGTGEERGEGRTRDDGKRSVRTEVGTTGEETSTALRAISRGFRWVRACSLRTDTHAPSLCAFVSQPLLVSSSFVRSFCFIHR
jgi:hypothetical protein